MIEIYGNLWDQDGPKVITTNGSVNSKGRAVMGAGVAVQAKNKYPTIDYVLGLRLQDRGNNVHVLFVNMETIFTFPVKHHWYEKADPLLIAKSASQLLSKVNLYAGDKRKIYMPRPGCGNGGLTWDEVKPLLTPILDDRFVIVELINDKIS